MPRISWLYMVVVAATGERPRRSLTVAMSTPFSSKSLAWLWLAFNRLVRSGSDIQYDIIQSCGTCSTPAL